jgi:putative transposase
VLRFTKKALKHHGKLQAIATDDLRPHGAAMVDLGCRKKQEVGRWTSGRIEISRLPFLRLERGWRGSGELTLEVRFRPRRFPQPLHPYGDLVDRQTRIERRSIAWAE